MNYLMLNESEPSVEQAFSYVLPVWSILSNGLSILDIYINWLLSLPSYRLQTASNVQVLFQHDRFDIIQ